MSRLLVLVAAAATASCASAFSLSTQPVSSLLETHASGIASLQEQAKKAGADIAQAPYSNDVFFLRYCLIDDDDSPADRLMETMKWRTSDQGIRICGAAQSAIAAATSADDGSWNNDNVPASAPHSAKITPYLTPKNILTTSSSKGDLVTCICAGLIDDAALMQSCTVDEMVEFFLYAKEISATVANSKSMDSNKLVCLLTANSLEGISLTGDATFRSALSESSKQSSPRYPTLNGPTLLVNLPKLLGAIVKIFTPLFPAAVKARLRFEQGPLKGCQDLMNVSYGGSERAKFMQDLDERIYNK